MSYILTLHQTPHYLHAVVTGPNTRENIVGYLADILSECEARDYDRVLIEECLEGPRLGTLDVFEIVQKGSKDAFRRLDAIAYVDVNAEGDLMRFAETVAINRGLRVAVFKTVSDAETWLRNLSSDTD